MFFCNDTLVFSIKKWSIFLLLHENGGSKSTELPGIDLIQTGSLGFLPLGSHVLCNQWSYLRPPSCKMPKSCGESLKNEKPHGEGERGQEHWDTRHVSEEAISEMLVVAQLPWRTSHGPETNLPTKCFPSSWHTKLWVKWNGCYKSLSFKVVCFFPARSKNRNYILKQGLAVTKNWNK